MSRSLQGNKAKRYLIQFMLFRFQADQVTKRHQEYMIMSKKQTWQEHRGKTDITDKDHCKSATNNICPQAED